MFFYVNIKLNSFLHCTLIPTEHLKSLTSFIWMFYASKVFPGPCLYISTHILATRTQMHANMYTHIFRVIAGSALYLISNTLPTHTETFSLEKELQTPDLCTWTRSFCFCLWNL